MLYWIVFTYLLTGSISEFYKRRINGPVFFLGYIILTLIMTLKQGQGQDYYNYYQIYKEVDYWSKNSIWAVIFMRGDPVYSLLNLFMINLGLSYKFFAAVFSLLIMIIQYPFFKRICKCSCICLFIFYATIYIPYDLSAMRQGMAMGIIMGVGFPQLLRRKRYRFILICVLASTIHLSALICLFLPFILDIKISHQATLFIIICAGGFALLGSNFLRQFPLPDFIFNRVDAYQESSSTKYLAITVRLIEILPILFITKKGYIQNNDLLQLKNILLFGFIVYSLCSFNDFVASRENIYFRMFEGLFLFRIVFSPFIHKIKLFVCSLYVVLSIIIFPKDILASMAQGEYRNCNLFTYPYFTLFDSNQTIAYYRTNFGYVDEQL